MSLYFHTVRWKNLLSTGNEFTELYLDKNKSTLIVGENGAGKSSFLDALAIGLYGLPFRDINKPTVINSITNKHMVVEVEMTINGSHYLIRRGMKPSKFEVFKDNNPIPFDQDAKSRDQQQIFEEEILKMNYTAFKQIVVLGKTDYVPFMKLKSKSRQEVIENLLDIKVFSIMAAILKQKNDVLTDDIKETNKSIEIATAELKVHEDYIATLHEDKATLLKQLRDKVKKGEQQVKKLISESEVLNKQAQALNDDVVDKSEVDNKIKQIVDCERRLEDKLNSLRREIAFYESNDNCPTCAQGIQHDFKEHTITIDLEKVTEVETALETLGERYQKESLRLAEITKTVDQIVEINSKVSNINTSINHYREYIDDLKIDIENLKSQNLHKIELEIERITNLIGSHSQSKEALLIAKEVYDAAGVLLKDNGIKTSIIKQYIPIINKLINKYLASMSFFINFEIDENFNETIKSAFREEFSYNNFSEGEKLRIDLAILFTWRAIAKMRNSMSTNLLVLDEIFDSSLDQVGVDDFLKIIKDVCSDVSGESNIFIISHKADQLIDRFDQVIKFEKHKNFSRIVV